VLAALAVLVAVAVGAARARAIDLAVYRVGGGAVLHRLELYRQLAPHTGLPFTYTPFAAVVFGPLAVVPWAVVKVVWTGLLFGCLAGYVALVAGLAAKNGRGPVAEAAAGRRWSPLALLVAVGAAAALEPVRHNFALGQVNLPLSLAVLYDVTGRGRAGWRGVAVGLAAAAKLTPLFFVPYLALIGRRADAGRALAAFVVATGVGFAAAPADSVRYWTSLAFDASRPGAPEYASNQSLRGMFSRLAGHPVNGTPGYLLVVLAVAALGLLVSARLARAGDPLGGVGICGLTALLVSPVSWTAHWVGALPALVWVACGPSGRRFVAAAAAYGIGALGLPWLPPAGDHREFGERSWQVLAGNSYVLLGLAVLMMASATVWHGCSKGHADAPDIRHPARASVV
jgi:alpha-1,2-mannosyltransferase